MFDVMTWLPLAFYIRRTELKLSQGQVAKRAGAARTYVSKIENGHCTPNIQSLQHFSAMLNSTPEHLVRMAEFLTFGK